MGSSPPLVSCLMVTQPSRTALALETIADVARQTYKNTELVVVTDGDGSSASPLTAACRDLKQRYVMIHGQRDMTLGMLRNITVAHATGPVILQFDDDDRAMPERIERQVAALDSRDDREGPPYVASCFTSQLCYFATDRRLYWIDWDLWARGAHWNLIPGTICARSAAVAAARYPETGPDASKGEDTVYLKRVRACGAVVGLPLQDGALYVRRYHGANTWNQMHFVGIARSAGHRCNWLRAEARRAAIQLALDTLRFAGPGPVTVMGQDGPAYTLQEAG
jgi:glycosyltransferase involved in cell wall biosynthesis